MLWFGSSSLFSIIELRGRYDGATLGLAGGRSFGIVLEFAIWRDFEVLVSVTTGRRQSCKLRDDRCLFCGIPLLGNEKLFHSGLYFDKYETCLCN